MVCKNRLIIHIGMHKTGSSSIQQSLHKNLDSPLFRYMNLQEANHSFIMQSVFNVDGKLNFSQRKLGTSLENIAQQNEQAKQRIEKEIFNHNAQTYILSGEGISYMTIGDLELLKKFFEKYFKEIKVVAYVRSPRGYIESAYQQGLKGGNSDFDFTKKYYPNYKKRFEKFDKVFGRENVEFWKFDPKIFPNGDVVLDFCRRLDIPMNPENTIRVNESLSTEAIGLLLIYRKFGPGYGVGSTVIKENNGMINSLRKIGSQKFKLSPSLVKLILDRNLDDIGWMEERLADSLEESFIENKNDIESEEELLDIGLGSVDALKEIVDVKYCANDITSKTYKEVATIVHGLRLEVQEKFK